MKVLVVIFVMISVTAAKITDDYLSKTFKSCGASYGGPNSIFKLVVGPNPDIQTLGQKALCVDIKTGATNENGDINKTVTREFIMFFTGGNKEKADKVVKSCTKRAGVTPEVASFYFWRCGRLIVDN
ncbi:uncharacterized protein LOC114332965 [Diabrotica virgifera virgifera]|uniref:Uncharacterized protein n=1 Tax=Diabrotica virgifera virgifera TaxID=50390 RepID=A0ABM5IQ34_DIAVI|nr:uncharacterized protein LOC114332965 [Diabrotica virgifera virgifera]